MHKGGKVRVSFLITIIYLRGVLLDSPFLFKFSEKFLLRLSEIKRDKTRIIENEWLIIKMKKNFSKKLLTDRRVRDIMVEQIKKRVFPYI